MFVSLSFKELDRIWLGESGILPKKSCLLPVRVTSRLTDGCLCE